MQVFVKTGISTVSALLMVAFTFSFTLGQRAINQLDPSQRVHKVDTAVIPYRQILRRIHKDQLLPFYPSSRQSQLKQGSSLGALETQLQADFQLLDTITGRYTDLDYSDHKRIGVDWMPALIRMRRMTLAYSHPQSKYYLNAALYNDISRALAYFCNYKPLPYCNNWYQQGITRPQTLALCLISMHGTGHQVPDSTLAVTIHAICKDTAVNSPGRNNPLHRYNSGANKSEIALGWIYIGCLIQNAHMLSVGARELYRPLQYTTGEGIQYDRSFDMHYGYLYNGAYGAVLLKSITKGAWFLKGTRYALKGDQLQFFSDFIIPSVFDQIRGKSMDWNILGRSISRYNATRPDFTLQLQRLQIIDPAHKKTYQNSRQRMLGQKPPSYKVKPDHQHYWHTDFTVHCRPGFYLSIHGVSNRNHAQEIGNQENLKGYWGAEGVMDLMVTGKEYVNIFPLWNWKRLPGATLPDTLIIPKDKAPGEGDRKGTSAFCGGVSDSINGITVYTIHNDLGLSARKAWFMAGNIIYCLGAGIQTTPDLDKEVLTTLNQCYFDSSTAVVLAKDGRTYKLEQPIDTVFTAQSMPDYIMHGAVAYFPLLNKPLLNKISGANNGEGQNLAADAGNTTMELKVDQRTSDWRGVNSSKYPAVSGKLFELSLNHGRHPQNATYCYAILPGITKGFNVGKFMAYHAPTVVANTDSIQAVYFRGLNREDNMHQIIFYKPGVSYHYNDLQIKADKPCLVMLRKVRPQKFKYKMEDKQRNVAYKLSVSDPSGLQKSVNIQISMDNESGLRLHHTYHMYLPDKPFSGKTVAKIIEF
ncbi:polysaccharide lyase 8 family protein [Arachidicoccus ginsenosidivorans]